MKCLSKIDNPNLEKELRKWKNVDIRLESGKHYKLYLTVNGKSKFVLLFCPTVKDTKRLAW